MLDSNNLPRSWQVKTLGEVCDIIMGQSPLGEKVIDKNQNTDSKALEFHQGKICFTDKFISESEVVTTDIRKIAPKDSILLCVRAPVGVVNITQRRIAIGRGLCALNLKDSSNDFLYFYLLTLNNYFNQKATGSTFSAINLDTIKNTKIPIPPLEIQKRIVKRLDGAFARIESGTKHLQSAKDNLTKYKQSLLKSAFNGTLTNESTKSTHPLAPSAREGEKEKCNPQSEIGQIIEGERESSHALKSLLPQHEGHLGVGNTRNDENSPSLAEGVRGWVNPRNDDKHCHTERSEVSKDKSVDFVDTSAFSKPQYDKILDSRNDDKDSLNGESENLPQGWTIKTLGEIAQIKGGKRLPKDTKYAETATPYPYIRVTDFENMSVDTTNLKYLTKETQQKIKNYTISKDDVYISIAGSIGKVGTIPDELDNANLTENAAKIVHSMDKKYLAFYLNSAEMQSQIAFSTKATTQPKLALYRIENLKIKIPPLETQKQIVAILEKHFTSADKVGAYIESCLTKAKQLKSSLLKSAFEGGLV